MKAIKKAISEQKEGTTKAKVSITGIFETGSNFSGSSYSRYIL